MEPPQELRHWLRLLWNRVPEIRVGAAQPFLLDGVVHVPATVHWQEQSAAAAHAVAHLVFSPAPFNGEGLGPIARALAGLLEDARVEALACRELPGLARLWQPSHRATPADGTSFEALMGRLARALCDPTYDDAHHWVRKGVSLFFADRELGIARPCTAAQVCELARRLGHDIGQMRLTFNSKLYRPAPAYRDDHRWMWPADVHEKRAPPEERFELDDDDHDDGEGSVLDGHDNLPLATVVSVEHFPEWDHLIRRERPNWVTLRELAVPSSAAPLGHANARAGLAEPHADPAFEALKDRMASWRLERASGNRAFDGERLHADALVRFGVSRRLGLTPDLRLYRAPAREPVRTAAWVMVDHSLSSMESWPASARRELRLRDVADHWAAELAKAMMRSGIAVRLAAFQSFGRQDVRVTVGATGPVSLKALPAGGSTRIGAALRFACARLRRTAAVKRWLVVLSDMDAHDIDVHDPKYLPEDMRHAVRRAARLGVRVVLVKLKAGQPLGLTGLLSALSQAASG